MATQTLDLPGGGLPPDMMGPQQEPAVYEMGTPPSAARKPAPSYGPNNEQLPRKLQLALQLLLTVFANEGQGARREEVERIRIAREFWKGLQYRYSDREGNWHLPGDASGLETAAEDDEHRPVYEFVTNFYQAFGLSIIAVLSQDIPAVKLWPQNPDQPEDVTSAQAGTDVIELVQRNNKIQKLVTDEAFLAWTDGKIGAYVRYVVDGTRFGWRDDDQLEERQVPLGEDVYQCIACGAETPAARFMGVCAQCGTPLDESHLKPADVMSAPVVRKTIPQANGAEVIDIVGGIELMTPPWANSQFQYPYIIWDQLAHRAKLRASFQHVRKDLKGSLPAPDDSTTEAARHAQISLISGSEIEPTGTDGDVTNNLVTFRQAWLADWAFDLLDDEQTVQELKQLFPMGAYVAFAGDVYCCSRNESMHDHWRVMHVLPGDGANRPAVGTSFISVQERYNTLSNLVMETVEYGIPYTVADTAVTDLQAFRQSRAVPGAVYPGSAPPGTNMAQAFFQSTPAQVSPDAVSHMQDLAGQTGQFLTGAFPALFGGEMDSNDTASGYQMARDQAMGRVGLVWRQMKEFHADMMLLAVDVFRKNRPDDVQMPVFGDGGQIKSKWIRLADLKGNIYAYPESDQQYPITWSQQNAVMLKLMESPDPMIQQVLGHPENLNLIKKAIALPELKIPDEDSRNKQLTEIDQLLEDGLAGLGPTAGMPALDPMTGQMVEGDPEPSVPIDDLLDNHQVEFETIQSWANSERGRQAKEENYIGFLNVRAHALKHQQQVMKAQAAAALAQVATGGGPPEGGDDGSDGL